MFLSGSGKPRRKCGGDYQFYCGFWHKTGSIVYTLPVRLLRPMLNRIDIHIEVPGVEYEKLMMG